MMQQYQYVPVPAAQLQNLYQAPPQLVMLNANDFDQQELWSFKDFVHKAGHGLEKAAAFGKHAYDAAQPYVNDAKASWKAHDPESYNQMKKYWQKPGAALKKFDANNGWGKAADFGGRMEAYLI